MSEEQKGAQQLIEQGTESKLADWAGSTEKEAGSRAADQAWSTGLGAESRAADRAGQGNQNGTRGMPNLWPICQKV